MSNYLSDKLTLLSTILIIMVVYIHSYYIEAEKYFVALFLQRFIGGGICRIANCLFFCISGYLFARNITDMSDVFVKQRKRLRTLLIPYLLWNVIFVLWYVVLEFLPGVSRFNNSMGMLDSYIHVPIWQSLYNLFVAPAAFQLWFLRDLLVMLVFTPLLWWIAKKQWGVALVLALCSTLVYGWLLYFWIGIIIGVTKCDIEHVSRPKLIMLSGVVVYLGYAIYLANGNQQIGILDIIVNLLGLYLVWTLYDVFAKGRCLSDKGIWKYICGYSFFIYCFHEPAFNVIKKLALVICGTSEPVLIFFYFLNPWVMVFVAVLVAKLLQRHVPAIYKILTGGR